MQKHYDLIAKYNVTYDPLVPKGPICHFVKWQILPFSTKVTIYCELLQGLNMLDKLFSIN